MGFAEGFSSGYGLMDATLRNQREETLKKDELATRTAQNADANARDDRRLGLAEVAQTDARNRDAATAKYQSDVLAGNQEEKKAMLGFRAQQSEEQASHNKDSLGLQKTTAEAHLEQLKQQSLNQAQTVKNDNAQLEINQAKEVRAKKEADQQDAVSDMHSNWTDASGNFDPKLIAADPDAAKKLKIGLNVDVEHMIPNRNEYHGAVQTVQNTMQNYDGQAPITSKSDPKTMDGVNVIFGNQLKTNVGKTVPNMGVIVNTRAVGIYPHQGTATSDNPDGKIYTMDLINTYRGKDGKEFDDPIEAPLTQLRLNDNPLDPVKGFTGAQLHGALQGNAAVIDGLINNPETVARWDREHKRNMPISKESKSIPYTDEDGNRQTGLRNNDVSVSDVRDVLKAPAEKKEAPVGKAKSGTPEGYITSLNGKSYINRGGDIYPYTKEN